MPLSEDIQKIDINSKYTWNIIKTPSCRQSRISTRAFHSTRANIQSWRANGARFMQLSNYVGTERSKHGGQIWRPNMARAPSLELRCLCNSLKFNEDIQAYMRRRNSRIIMLILYVDCHLHITFLTNVIMKLGSECGHFVYGRHLCESCGIIYLQDIISGSFHFSWWLHRNDLHLKLLLLFVVLSLWRGNWRCIWNLSHGTINLVGTVWMMYISSKLDCRRRV